MVFTINFDNCRFLSKNSSSNSFTAEKPLFGFTLENEVKILDICNPKIAYDIFTQDMSVACAMPCKIAVYSENGQTIVALNSSTFSLLSVGKVLTA